MWKNAALLDIGLFIGHLDDKGFFSPSIRFDKKDLVEGLPSSKEHLLWILNETGTVRVFIDRQILETKVTCFILF